MPCDCLGGSSPKPASSTARQSCKTMSNLDDLNARVTDAILRAERLPEDSIEALAAFREVRQLEAAIAKLTPPDDVEGEKAWR